jgi:hypothetical protein
MPESKYVLQLTSKSICPDCGENVHLLCPDGVKLLNGRMFFICFTCKTVAEAGVGKVLDCDADDDEEGHEKISENHA